MSYANLILEETVSSQYLIVIRPRRRVTSFTLVSGSVYSAPFDYGEVTTCWFDGASLTQGTSSSLSASQYWHDYDNSLLYVRTAGGVDPDTGWLVAGYEIYAATTSAHWHRVPTDTSTRVVFFDPIVSKSPVFKSSSTDVSFGFNPIQTSTMTLINSEHEFDRHIHDSSFNKADCFVYHWLGALDAANISRVLSGSVTSVSLDPPNISFQVVDRFDDLSQEWRHPGTADSFFSLASFPNLDPNNVDDAIPKYYGFVTGGAIPVNISYVAEGATTSDNRTWVVCTGQTGLGDITATVPASPVSTTTRTYVSSVDGFNEGDSVWIDKASDEYVTITAVGANYIEHAALVVAATTGDTVKRAFVGAVSVVQSNVEYVAQYGRDYTVSHALAGETSGLVFSTSLEANLSMPQTLAPTDQVLCRVYGPTNSLTLGGPAFGSNDARTANMAHPVQVVLDILKTHIGISESDLDTASFTAALTGQDSGVGISVLKNANSKSFPKYKDILSSISKSTLSKLLIDQTGLWSIVTLAPLGTPDFSVADDEIQKNSISFDYDYTDVVSEVVVKFAREQRTATSFSETFSSVTVTSDVASYLHLVSKSRVEDSIWSYSGEATTLASHLAFLYGDRQGTVSIKVKNRFYSAKLGDVVEISRAYLPGNSVDGVTIFTRSHSVTTTDKRRTEISLDLNDFKGMQDNIGGW